MSNKGSLSGTNANSWKFYEPTIITASKSGTPTQPNQGSVSVRYGRFIKRGKLVMMQAQINFGTSPNKGVGDAYLFRLPVPARRAFDDPSRQQIIGAGFSYHAITGNAYNQPIIATLSDKYESNANEQDSYAQFHIGGYALAFGTGSFTNLSSTTITHNLGFTPNAADIDITFTSNLPSDTAQGNYWISNITSTTFDVNIRNNPPMYTNLIGQADTGVTVTGARYIAIYGGGLGWSSTVVVSGCSTVMPCSGTLDHLYITVDTAAGTGVTRTFTVYKNGVDTALTVSLTDPAVTGSDITNSVAFVAGDVISLKTTSSGTSTAQGNTAFTLRASCAPNTSMIIGSSSATMSNSINTYVVLSGSFSNTASAGNVEEVMPTAGTIKNAYAVLQNTPGAGKSYTFTLVQNTVDTGITFAISDTNTTGNDTTHSITVAAGDKLYWKVVPSGTPTVRGVSISVEFDPTVNGESVHMFGGQSNMQNGGVRYQTITASAKTFGSTSPTGVTVLSQPATWQKMYVYAPTATGATKTWSFGILTPINGFTIPPNPVITNASTSASDTSTSISIRDDPPLLMAMQITPANTPTVSLVEWGIVSNMNLTDTQTFSWKVRAEPTSAVQQVLSPAIPWATAQQQDFFIQMYYEPKD